MASLTYKTPCGNVDIDVPSLGNIRGLLFDNGTRQFCGIQYGDIAQRWTRATLRTWLTNGFHDGTQQGPIPPQPPELTGTDDSDEIIPPIPHFKETIEDEFNCLCLNVVLPPKDMPGPHPVMVWVHGGAFLFGHASHPAYDMVNLVSHSVAREEPVIIVSINYRLGLFGFLASDAIAKDLASRNQQGCGNFGLTDQQVALEWVQRYITHFGGDVNNITLFGESAGSMSVAHQMAARKPAPFNRAICMSGMLNTIPVWTIERHERRWAALAKYLGVDPMAPDALQKLRDLPHETIAAASCPIEGMVDTSSNPCYDGWFHAEPPSPTVVRPPAEWLKSCMFGDVRDEAMIYPLESCDDYHSMKQRFSKFLSEANTDTIMARYGITPNTMGTEFTKCFEDMAGDVFFKIHTKLFAHSSKLPGTFCYHFDQPSTVKNSLEGKAYHALDLLYLFLNIMGTMAPMQQELAREMANRFISFARGRDPWERFRVNQRWMIFGPDGKGEMQTESEDEPVRRYQRMDEMLAMGLYQEWTNALDDMVRKRERQGRAKPIR